MPLVQEACTRCSHMKSRSKTLRKGEKKWLVVMTPCNVYSSQDMAERSQHPRQANQTYWLHFTDDKAKAQVTDLVQGRARPEPEPEIIPFITLSATQSNQGGEHLQWQQAAQRLLFLEQGPGRAQLALEQHFPRFTMTKSMNLHSIYTSPSQPIIKCLCCARNVSRLLLARQKETWQMEPGV